MDGLVRSSSKTDGEVFEDAARTATSAELLRCKGNCGLTTRDVATARPVQAASEQEVVVNLDAPRC